MARADPSCHVMRRSLHDCHLTGFSIVHLSHTWLARADVWNVPRRQGPSHHDARAGEHTYTIYRKTRSIYEASIVLKPDVEFQSVNVISSREQIYQAS